MDESLEIPDAAIYAAAQAASIDLKIYSTAPIESALHGAAPLIIAAAYRKFAEILEVYAAEAEKRVPSSGTSTIPSQTPAGWIGRALAYENVANMLYNEADKLEQ
jgi:hypothetical protein